MSNTNFLIDEAIRIRAFEQHLLELFNRGMIFGTVHTCVGQELCATALHKHLEPGKDYFIGTHRAHGHYLAHGGSAEEFIAELMGREGALCGGRGGTQHLCFKRFFSNGIQGASAPIGVGLAYTQKQKNENGIVVVQMGDGTLGEGAIYEAAAFAALKQVPILFFLEFNGYAQSTDVSTTTPGSPADRFRAFGLDTIELNDNDPELLDTSMKSVVNRVRTNKPTVVIIHTRRLMPHSKGDDNRPGELIAELRKKDPISNLLLTSEKHKAHFDKCTGEFEALSLEIEQRNFITSPENIDLAYPVALKLPGTDFACSEEEQGGTVLEALNQALIELFEDKRCVLVGEDLLDPYGGAFKVSKGLSSKYPDQVFSTPISESAIAGFAIGAALGGNRSIAEIMFGDFVTLAADQLINSAAKFYFMFNGKVTCPAVIRVVSGGGRGYGPTHSQSLERLFCGVPGLKVIAPSRRHDVKKLFKYVVNSEEAPVVWVEAKTLYLEKLLSFPPTGFVLANEQKENNRSSNYYANLVFVPDDADAKAEMTLVTYGTMLGAVEFAAKKLLLDHEIYSDIIVITQLWPLNVNEVIESVKRTGRLAVIEEGVPDYGISSAIIAKVLNQCTSNIATKAIGSIALPIPAVRHQEKTILPSEERVLKQLIELYTNGK